MVRPADQIMTTATAQPRPSNNLLLEKDGIRFVTYSNEAQMPGIVRLIERDLSEPYSIFTYRYFIYNWPDLCVLAYVDDAGKRGGGKSDGDDGMVAVIVCKAEPHRLGAMRGYLGMLAVDKAFRKRGIGSSLAQLAIKQMRDVYRCKEAVLETELTNAGALRLYENLGFIRDKRLQRYYLNGTDAFRLKLFLTPNVASETSAEQGRPSSDVANAGKGGNGGQSVADGRRVSAPPRGRPRGRGASGDADSEDAETDGIDAQLAGTSLGCEEGS
jgi:peptide alpha-N-acetyltransferase